MTWPPNIPERLVLLQQLETKLNRIRAAQTQVVLYSRDKPTQAQWESAFVQQTAEQLPIPPGVNLFWYDLKGGEQRLFQTAFDTGNGVLSSGAVYELTGSPTTKHLLGRINSIGRYVDYYTRIPNWEQYALDGLEMLEIIYDYKEFSGSLLTSGLTLDFLDEREHGEYPDLYHFDSVGINDTSPYTALDGQSLSIPLNAVGSGSTGGFTTKPYRIFINTGFGSYDNNRLMAGSGEINSIHNTSFTADLFVFFKRGDFPMNANFQIRLDRNNSYPADLDEPNFETNVTFSGLVIGHFNQPIAAPGRF